MCGIFMAIGDALSNGGDIPEEIKRRGPDHSSTLTFTVHNKRIQVSASVLGMRGSSVQTQPIYENALLFCWNGEVYDGLSLDQSTSDTKALFDLFANDRSSIDRTLQSIRGEFAFVLIDFANGYLYFGRDCLGRRSLLTASQDGLFLISSVAVDSNQLKWEEVKCAGYFKMQLDTLQLTLIEWSHKFTFNTSLEIVDPQLFVSDLLAKLRESVKRRLFPLPVGAESVAVLFSGGLDCSMLAWLIDQLLPEHICLDLLNVAFENHRSIANGSKTGNENRNHLNSIDSLPIEIDSNAKNISDNMFNVPDRISAIESFSELVAYSKRKIRLIKVNVPYETYVNTKPTVIQLMHPAASVMDLSIAIAVWHASRGQGVDHLTSMPVKSAAKIVFSGIGADEQFGGYSRHRMKYCNAGLSGLIAELQLDLERIWIRNLGRDDRCVADWGREARFPFLDEAFVSFASSLPTSAKCNLQLERGIGDKQLLRLAAEQLGISKASRYAKRAIQFGTRTAKMENSKEQGTDNLVD